MRPLRPRTCRRCGRRSRAALRGPAPGPRLLSPLPWSALAAGPGGLPPWDRIARAFGAVYADLAVVRIRNWVPGPGRTAARALGGAVVGAVAVAGIAAGVALPPGAVVVAALAGAAVGAGRVTSLSKRDIVDRVN